MNAKLKSKLTINPFTLPIHLGCEDWERQKSQNVDFQISFGFTSKLKAEESDELGDSVCYSKVCSIISKLTHEKHYKLIERLAEDIRQTLIKNFTKHDLLKVRVHKLNPPIEALTNGVVYECGDLNL